MGSKKSRDQIAREKAKKKTAEQKQQKFQDMPMNRDFLLKANEDGTLKYPLAGKLLKYLDLQFENIYDIMRQVSAYIAQIKHHQNRIYRLEEQYTSEKIVEKDEEGRIYTRSEIQLLIVSEKVAIPRDLSKIREHVVHKLLPLVNGVTFTGDQYNEYVCKVDEKVKALGYDLIPEKLELIFPEL